MTQSLHPAAQKGFSSAAELYQQVRPSYPQNIPLWLQDRLKVTSQAQALDLASGTGKFLPYLQQLTQNIIAVEPVTEMLAQLKQTYPHIKTVQSFSHDIPIESNSIDIVTCAQAFHWFANIETLTEVHRILKKDGFFVLIWNQRDIRVDWVKALAEYLIPLEGDTPRFHSDLWKNVFKKQNLFKPFEEITFTQIQHGTVEQVVSNRLLSTSFIAAMPKAEQQKLKVDFEKIVEDYTRKSAQDEIDFPYTTYVYIFQKISSE